jgi:hypothetical protein
MFYCDHCHEYHDNESPIDNLCSSCYDEVGHRWCYSCNCPAFTEDGDYSCWCS